jgi:hypothetical protein
MGDVFAGSVGFGFLVSDCRDGAAEPMIDEEMTRAIVSAAGGNINASLSRANLFEISQEEFDSFRETAISVPGLPEGLALWQVKS